MITILHNPRCSKSRETLALVENVSTSKQLALKVVEYLKTPLTLEELQTLQTQLGLQGADMRAMLRDNEEEYALLKLEDASDTAALAAIATYPQLLQRPIVIYGDHARIGRPPENVLDLFQ